MQPNYAFTSIPDVARPFQEVTFVYPQEQIKVRVCHAFELEPVYQTKLDNLFTNLKRDAKQYILDNPYKVNSMHEFKGILEDELSDVTKCVRKKKNRKAMEQSYDLLVKHAALHILTVELSNR